MILNEATCTAAAGVAVQDRLAGEPEWGRSPGRWAERSAEWQLAYRTVFYDGPKAQGVSMTSQPQWVVWGLSTEGPTQLAQGSWEQCRSQQSAFEGWLTGIYRAGAEPKGLLVIMEQQGMTSQRESTNRAIKASVILETLDRFVRARTPMTADELERMDDRGWEALTRIAAQNAGTEWTDASPETRVTVIGVLRGREVTPNPFVGFPK